MPKNIVLLTATVTPQANQAQLSIVDPSSRLDDYRNALALYYRLLEERVIDGIIFAENSGFLLDTLKQEFPSPEVEWISSHDTNYPSTYHRGYGEFRLIDDAMDRSTTVNRLLPTDRIWKITGRYQILNLKRLIDTAPAFDLYCDSSDVWTEMSVMAWTAHGYRRRLAKVWQAFASGKAPELILADRLMNTGDANDYILVTALAWPPLIQGRRGTDGSEFTNRRSRIKFMIKLLPYWLKHAFRGLSTSHHG